jgi:sugar lactone lactonase YvrE
MMGNNGKYRLYVLCVFAALSFGCAATWAPVKESTPHPPLWMDSSQLARATYVESISGFKQTRSGFSGAMQALVFGDQAIDNSVRRPVAVAIGRDERIAIADPGRACVHLYIPAEQKYRRIYRADKSDLKTPVSVAFDDESRLYVSDSSRRAIFLFDREGVFLSAITKAGEDPLLRPSGLSFSYHNRMLYAVDTVACKVHAFNTAGSLNFSFGKPGDQPGQFNLPTHIVARADGRLYVTDAMNFRVQVFDASGKFLSVFGHHGNGSGDLSLPKGIALDRAGVIYLVDTLFDNVQLFDEAGKFLFTIGSRGNGQGEFWLPSGLFIDDRDRLYVCDTYNQRVQVFKLMRDANE